MMMIIHEKICIYIYIYGVLSCGINFVLDISTGIIYMQNDDCDECKHEGSAGLEEGKAPWDSCFDANGRQRMGSQASDAGWERPSDVCRL